MKVLIFAFLFGIFAVALSAQTPRPCCDSAALKSGCPPGVPICQYKSPTPRRTPTARPPTPIPPVTSTRVPLMPAQGKTAPPQSTKAPVPPIPSASSSPKALVSSKTDYIIAGILFAGAVWVGITVFRNRPKPPSIGA